MAKIDRAARGAEIRQTLANVMAGGLGWESTPEGPIFWYKAYMALGVTYNAVVRPYEYPEWLLALSAVLADLIKYGNPTPIEIKLSEYVRLKIKSVYEPKLSDDNG